MSKVIIVMGPAGSGKGTQAQQLVERYSLQKIETGEIIRAMAKEDSEMGHKLKKIHESGEHVSDGLMKELVADAVNKLDRTRGILFDGYPRTLPQAKDIDEILGQYKLAKDLRVIWVNVGLKEAKRRLTNRAVCTKCGKIFTDREQAVCSDCGGPIEVRDYDMDEAAIDKRLDFFQQEVMPVITHYTEKGRLIEIKGEQSIDDVTLEILNKLEAVEL